MILGFFFYQLAQQPEFYPRNCVGRRISGEAAAALGGDPSKVYRLAFKVLAMGDLNAVPVAQRMHTDLVTCLRVTGACSHIKR